MRRVVCREFGPVDQLSIVEEPDPEPGVGDVVVAVEAAAVSFVDSLIVQGRYQVKPALPYTPGTAMCGSVQTIGSGVDSVDVGDRVSVLSLAGGGFTTHLVAPAEGLARLPVGLAAEVAATAIENYSTMAFALSRRVVVRPAEWVLVLGAGGGVGLAAVDVARAAGGRVIAAASSETKRAAAHRSGAEVVIDYADLKDQVRDLTGGGADVAIDPVGGPVAEQALRSLTAYGRLCVLGFASGAIPRLPANIVLLRNRTVVGVDWGDWAPTHPGGGRRPHGSGPRSDRTWRVRPPAPTCLPLEKAVHALTLLARGDVVGKIALTP